MRVANILPLVYDPSFYSPPASVIGAGNTFEWVPSRFKVHAANEVDLMLMGVATVDAAIRADRAGFDAALFNGFLCTGLRAAKAACRMPVVGAGEAGMLTATGIAHRFSIVSIWPESVRPLHAAQLREYGLEDHCASLRFVTSEAEMATLGDDEGFYLGLKARRGDVIERIGDEIHRAVHYDGADAIVLGCTCMSLATADLQRRSDVPVVDPLASGFLQAESLARLGAGQNRAAFRPPPVARDDVFEAMVSAAATALEGEGQAGDGCEVCMVGEEDGAPEPATSAVSSS